MLKNLKGKADTMQKEKEKLQNQIKQNLEEYECLAMKSETLEQVHFSSMH